VTVPGTGLSAVQPEKINIQIQLSGPDLERLVLIGGDLEYLADLPTDRLLSHTEVRLAAGVIRRLFIDKQLSILWKRVEPSVYSRLTVEAYEIDSVLDKWPEEWIRTAWAGGAPLDGLAHHNGSIFAIIPRDVIASYGSPEKFREANPLPMTGIERRMSIEGWLNSTSVAIQTNELGLVRISRSTVLKYLANRKGGIHFDPHRALRLPNRNKQRKESEFFLLDHGLLRIGHLSGPEYELTALIRSLRKADWAQEIVRVAKETAPEDFGGDPRELKFWTGLKEADGTGWATTKFGPNVAGDPDHPIGPSDAPDA
jgi:hypothetical protein